ncbi:MAG: DNA topoisomerase, partial [bacterium]|nr:DNA topoisomerase [bacterium]
SAPFITSTLQQEAARKLGFTAKRTMMVAQSLYEGVDLGKEGSAGLITYMRTDSTKISAEALDAAAIYIQRTYGQGMHHARTFAGSEGAREAHEAIRPADVERTPEVLLPYLSKDQHRLYKLIFERFIASQMSAATYDTVAIDILANGYVFRCSESVLVNKGFRIVYSESADTEAVEPEDSLPDLKIDTLLTLNGLLPKQHFTEPPFRFTEASLIKLLEEKGIGRPSTYAPIIDTIINRGYTQKEKKHFMATELGHIVAGWLKRYFPGVVDVGFTADMEAKLDIIEKGTTKWQDVLQEFWQPFSKELEDAALSPDVPQIANEISDVVCDLCGRQMLIRQGRYGKFLGCPGFPACRNTKPILVETGTICPLCSSPVVERRMKKGGILFGCSSYPACNFATRYRPSDKLCPVCGKNLSKKNTKIDDDGLVCVNPNCSAVIK